MDSMINQIGNLIVWIWTLDGAKVIIAHVTLNAVVAVAASVYTGEFRLKKLGEFLYRKLAPFVGVYAVVKAVGIHAGLDGLAPIVWGVIELTLIGDLTENLQRLGIPLPERV